MGYIADIDDPDAHEGYVVMTYADGKISSGTSCSQGIYLDGYTYLPGTAEIDPAYLRPFSETVGWMPVCECGWHGVSVEVPHDDDLDDLGRKYREPSGHQEYLLMSQWRLHIRDHVQAA